ncbi:ABC transporter permease subunit [Cytobacillus depressus]|uniref:ABC transporter permease subunit n=1 Tax=Cytobacillus depressus TaxID=1602942 RepID=A0A6L3V436_9BACI|nr:ABC transporter permease [Cytobacillus depressus]KAB2333141.1 ABC transporter permease subunit [Cytobacillus depressus]
MGKVLRSEFLKLRKSSIWLLIFISPILASLTGLGEISRDSLAYQWEMTLSIMVFLHALLFLPLLTGVFSAFVCRYEHTGGGWKQLLAMPVSRGNVFITKFILVVGLLALTQILFTAGLLIIGQLQGFEAAIPWKMIATSVIGGWIACLPLAALQLFVSIAWSSFATPLAINVIFTLPNILVVNSEKFGPYYPWGQPFLLMMPGAGDSFGALNVPLGTLMIVILGGLVLFFVSGFIYFQRKEV